LAPHRVPVQVWDTRDRHQDRHMEKQILVDHRQSPLAASYE
jgi:hypothetical protein